MISEGLGGGEQKRSFKTREDVGMMMVGGLEATDGVEDVELGGHAITIG